MEEHDSAVISSGEREKWKFMNITCRLCSSECHTKSKNIMQKKILEMIDTCSSLRLSAVDGLPTRICSSCIQTLIICFRFRKKIETTDVLLRKKFKSLFPRQDILDIALNKANIKRKDTKEDEKKLVSKVDVEDNLNCSVISKYNEEKKEDNIQNSIEPDQEKSEEASFEISLPPLVPIQSTENPKKKNLTHILQEPPPLIPLTTNSSESLSSNMILLEPIETACCENSENLLKNSEETCEPSKILSCNICKKEYKEGKKLIGHLKGHIVSKKFVCKICGKKYPNPSTFQIHMRSHTGERPFKCPVCNKGFTRWAGVVSHMQTHEDNRPFKCDSCDQSFKILSNLERHKVLHAGVLPFCCNYCGKTFSQSANLQLHIRTYHTNERPYLCSECGKGFVSSTRLNRHMWVHKGYKPFHCKTCSKAYSNSCDLKNHESGAHGNGDSKKPFACNVCDKKFFYSCRLNKHFKTHHQ